MYFFKTFPLISRLVFVVVIPFLCVFISCAFFLYRSLPLESGSVYLDGVSETVGLSYDANGVPFIVASTDHDAYFALGFVHSQNRLWQMEMGRRTASGRLSEVMGRATLPSDIFFRTLGLRINAEKIWESLPAAEKQILESYVDGINAGISALDSLPIEYYLKGFSVEPWISIDSLAIFQLNTYQNSSNMASELQRSSLLRAFGLDKTNSLLPEVKLRAVPGLAEASLVPASYRLPRPYVGSNSWVVSGEHTLSGMPMLANDPHLNNTLPSAFYLANIQGDRLDVSGATIPGLPFVAIGRNADIAWGATNMMADTQDIFLEKIHPHNPLQYEVDGEYRDMSVRHELIQIKAQPMKAAPPPHSFDVRRTDHGPVLSDLFGTHKNHEYSLRWTGDDDDGGTFTSFIALNYARNWLEFNQALAGAVAPIYHFVYADKEGNIGSLAPGAYPVRQGGGAIPRAGWLSENDWQGWLATEDWPRTSNPEKGFIVAANHSSVDMDYPHYITSDWSPAYRAQRIQALLDRQILSRPSTLMTDDFISIQLDTYYSAATSLLPYFRQLKGATSAQKEVLDVLRGWDARMSAESVGSTIISVWMSHFTRLLLEDDIEKLVDFGGDGVALSSLSVTENQALVEALLLDKRHQDWCDYGMSVIVESCDDLLLIALDHAIAELNKILGSTVSQWHWQRLHKAHFYHYPMSPTKYMTTAPGGVDSPLSVLFHRAVASVGGGNTVNVAPSSWSKNTRFAQFYGPAYRYIVDLAQPDKSLHSLSTGQSGNVLSRHYDDLLSPHQQGMYFTLERPINGEHLMLSPHKHIENTFRGN